MKREEAREILTHNWTRVDNPNYSESELDEAFFMAIEALKRKPILCSHCKHYIRHDHRCGWWNHGVSNVDWCSHAERREP